MKAPAFAYQVARSTDEAVAILHAHGGDAKLLAGGQSLMPMLNFRLLSPAILVDINGIAGLDRIELEGDELHIGALTRHRQLQTSTLAARRLPLLPSLMGHVAHVAIRNAGTVGGSLSHADPAAELPLLAQLLDARFDVTGPQAGREIAASDFFVAPLQTALRDDEMLTRVRFPLPPQEHRSSFFEVARRRGDFALAAAGAVLTLDEEKVTSARIALIGAAETAIRAPGAEQALLGEALGTAAVARAVEAVRENARPESDLHASARYRRHLVGVLVQRCLEQIMGVGR